MQTVLFRSSIRPLRTVILGSAGFVGQASSRALAAEGMSVLDLSRREVDLLAPDASAQLAALLDPGDCLVFVAAVAPVKTPAMLLDNLRMVQAVCAAIKQRPVAHLVYISSDAVYRDSAEPLSEHSCAEPGSLHGGMHLVREIMLRTELSGIPCVFIRPTLIYGPGDPHNGYGPNRFLRLAVAGRDIRLFGEGEERRDHIAIDDVADLVRRCVLGRATGIANAASGTVISFREVAELAIELSGSRSKIISAPRTGPMPHGGYRSFDLSFLQGTLSDFFPRPLRLGLEEMCSSLLSQTP